MNSVALPVVECSLLTSNLKFCLTTYTKTQFLFQCQQKLIRDQMGHPVHLNRGNIFERVSTRKYCNLDAGSDPNKVNNIGSTPGVP